MIFIGGTEPQSLWQEVTTLLRLAWVKEYFTQQVHAKYDYWTKNPEFRRMLKNHVPDDKLPTVDRPMRIPFLALASLRAEAAQSARISSDQERH